MFSHRVPLNADHVIYSHYLWHNIWGCAQVSNNFRIIFWRDLIVLDVLCCYYCVYSVKNVFIMILTIIWFYHDFIRFNWRCMNILSIKCIFKNWCDFVTVCHAWSQCWLSWLSMTKHPKWSSKLRSTFAYLNLQTHPLNPHLHPPTPKRTRVIT